MTFSVLSILFASFFTSTILKPHALPAPQASPSELSSGSFAPDNLVLNTTAPNADYFVCYDAPMMRSSQRAPTSDCLKAVLRLSRRTDTAVFHQEGGYDGYRLPIQKTYGSCSVTVEVTPGYREDRSSWVGISLLASQLTQACSTLNFPSGKTGGETFEGNEGKVRIKVGKPRSSMEAMNGTKTEIDEGNAIGLPSDAEPTQLENGATVDGGRISSN